MIDIKNLTKSYGDNEVLKDISLKVEKGDILFILGKNGAGKSTLFKVILGLTRPSMGKIMLMGSESFNDKLRSKIGFSIDTPVFYDNLSGKENLEIFCDYNMVNKRNIKGIMEKVNLNFNNKTPVKNYSLGMKQRLVLAKCFIHDPDLIIIDEPLNGLDPKAIKMFRDIVKEFSLKGKTFLISSHILSEIREIASRIAIISEGRIVLDEDIKFILDNHNMDFEEFLINKMEGF